MGVRQHSVEQGFAYFVTTNTIDRRPIFARREAARFFLETLADVRREQGLKLLAYVVMPDHVHLVLVPGRYGLGEAMKSLKGRFARHCNQARSESGSLWQDKYHEAIVRSDEQLSAYVDYVHYNPVEAGLCHEPEDWPYTSARQGGGPDLIPFLTAGEPD